MKKQAPKVNLEGCWIDTVQIGFGLHLYVLFVRASAAPAGMVWGISMSAGNAGKQRFEVAGSYVEPWARRSGVRTRINQEIHQSFPVISTQNGSKDGGASFMRASGYVMDKRSGIWSKCK